MADDPKRPLEVGPSLEQERERTVQVVSMHFAHDNLSLEELERRIEAAVHATSVAALRDITRDLPGDAEDSAQRRAAPVPAAFAPEHERIVSIMSETKRRGLWAVPKRLDLWTIMSDTKIDLTEAQLGAGVTEIRVRGLMASIRVIVPPGVRVVLQPNSLMSAVLDDIPHQPAVGSGAPVVRITGPVIMSELKVKVRVRELPEIAAESEED